MKRLCIITISCLMSLMVSSCGDSFEGNYWGQTRYADPFLGSIGKCPVDTLKGTLEVDFNDHAQSLLTEPLVLALYRNDGGKAIPVKPNEAEVYVNNVLSKDNTISISKDCDGEVNLGVVLKGSLIEVSSDQDYTFLFRVINNPGLDRVNDINVTDRQNVMMSEDVFTLMPIHVYHVVNKWRVGTNITLIIIVICIILLIILSRISHPAFGVRRIYLIIGSTQRTISLKGAGRVLLTKDKKKSQSIIRTLFIRKTIFVVDEFFSAGDLLVEPKFRINTDSGRRNGVRLSGKAYNIPCKNLAKDQDEDISLFDSSIKIKIQ